MPSSEPVIFAGLARVAVLAAAHFGFHLDAVSIVGAMLALEAALTPFLRSKVSPAKA
jgi:hypothetical protein